MKTFIDEARYLFLESTGWSRLTWRDRWVAIYFALSLAAIIITAEAPIWVMIAMMLNFFNAARMVQTIDLPPEEDEVTDADNEDETEEEASKP